ncbi:unnamed protein product [Pleuronectes platessa]|uniref:Uncharacterized protein n=1 Tax=Pleuronectes platessa TaxID=8262 RepID=A0A9N7UG56_PLEPL|nr:unnamed protein product [Pleuronectes platessa]
MKKIVMKMTSCDSSSEAICALLTSTRRRLASSPITPLPVERKRQADTQRRRREREGGKLETEMSRAAVKSDLLAHQDLGVGTSGGEEERRAEERKRRGEEEEEERRGEKEERRRRGRGDIFIPEYQFTRGQKDLQAKQPSPLCLHQQRVQTQFSANQRQITSAPTPLPAPPGAHSISSGVQGWRNRAMRRRRLRTHGTPTCRIRARCSGAGGPPSGDVLLEEAIFKSRSEPPPLDRLSSVLLDILSRGLLLEERRAARLLLRGERWYSARGPSLCTRLAGARDHSAATESVCVPT